MIATPTEVELSQGTLDWVFATQSDPCRRHRDQNEDRTFFKSRDGKWLIGIADGMGGLDGGEMAAEAAIAGLEDEVRTQLFSPEANVESVTAAFGRGFGFAHDLIRKHCPSAGTTLTALALIEEQLIVCHIGDTRAYVFRDDKVIPLTIDDNEFERDHAFVDRHPFPNKHDDLVALSCLTAYLGSRPSQPRIYIEAIEAEDWFLLTSDGIHDRVSDADIESILVRCSSPAEAAQRILSAARRAGLTDNATIIVAGARNRIPNVPIERRRTLFDSIDAINGPRGILLGVTVLAILVLATLAFLLRAPFKVSSRSEIVDVSVPTSIGHSATTGKTIQPKLTDPEAARQRKQELIAAKLKAAALQHEKQIKAEEEVTPVHHSSKPPVTVTKPIKPKSLVKEPAEATAPAGLLPQLRDQKVSSAKGGSHV